MDKFKDIKKDFSYQYTMQIDSIKIQPFHTIQKIELRLIWTHISQLLVYFYDTQF